MVILKDTYVLDRATDFIRYYIKELKAGRHPRIEYLEKTDLLIQSMYTHVVDEEAPNHACSACIDRIIEGRHVCGEDDDAANDRYFDR